MIEYIFFETKRLPIQILYGLPGVTFGVARLREFILMGGNTAASLACAHEVQTHALTWGTGNVLGRLVVYTGSWRGSRWPTMRARGDIQLLRQPGDRQAPGAALRFS